MENNDSSKIINITDIAEKYPLIAKVITEFTAGDNDKIKIVDRDAESYSDCILDVKLKKSKDDSGFTLYSKVTEKVDEGDEYAKNIDFIHIKASRIENDDSKINVTNFFTYLTKEDEESYVSGKFDLLEKWDDFVSQSVGDGKELFFYTDNTDV